MNREEGEEGRRRGGVVVVYLLKVSAVCVCVSILPFTLDDLQQLHNLYEVQLPYLTATIIIPLY